MFEFKQIILDSNNVYLHRLILSQIFEAEKIDINLTPLVHKSYGPVCYESSFIFNNQKYYIYIYSDKKSIVENQKRIVYNNLDLSNNYFLISLISFSSIFDKVTYFIYIFLFTDNSYRLKTKDNFYRNFEKESNLTPHDEFLFPRYYSTSSEFELVGFGY
jgi:hypothetical protein